jgi:hypothetical protein
MISCRERSLVRAETVRRLAATDWGREAELVLDDESGADRLDRIHRTWHRALECAARAAGDFVLLLEDDLIFCRRLRTNLESWNPLARTSRRQPFYASLYNPGMPYLWRNVRDRFMVAHPHDIWGSQAIVMTPITAAFVAAQWGSADGNPDQRMPRIAARVTPVYYHLPSLVDHAPVETTWGGVVHKARDFDENFNP